MQETQVQSLVWDDLTCRRATKPVPQPLNMCALEPGNSNYWIPCALQPGFHSKRSPCSEMPVHHSKRVTPTCHKKEKPAQQPRLRTAKNKYINNSFKKSLVRWKTYLGSISGNTALCDCKQTAHDVITHLDLARHLGVWCQVGLRKHHYG